MPPVAAGYIIWGVALNNALFRTLFGHFTAVLDVGSPPLQVTTTLNDWPGFTLAEDISVVMLIELAEAIEWHPSHAFS